MKNLTQEEVLDGSVTLNISKDKNMNIELILNLDLSTCSTRKT